MEFDTDDLDLEGSSIQDVTPQINELLVQILETASVLLQGMKQRVLEASVFICVILLVFWVSVFLYASFYYSFMPTASFFTPVHFCYRTDCPHLTVCSFPGANISLLKEGNQQVMTYGQPYQITLELEMPESPANQQLGMFLVKMTPFSRSGQIIDVSTRSAMLHYRSPLLQALSTLVFFPVLLTGASEQKQTVRVELFSEFKDDLDKPAAGVLIEVYSQRVQIYSAHLYIFAHFRGIRYLLHHFPLLSAAIGIVSNFTFIIALGFLQFNEDVQTEERSEIDEQNEQSEPENMDSLEPPAVNSIPNAEESEDSGVLHEDEPTCGHMVLRHKLSSQGISRSSGALTDSTDRSYYRVGVCSSS